MMKRARERRARAENAAPADPTRYRADWRAWLVLGIALFVLNAAVTFHNVWPTYGITLRNELSIDLAVVLLVLGLYRERFGPLPRHLVSGLAVLWLVLALGRYADVTAPALYGRPVNLYWDAPHVLNVAAMLAEAAAPQWLATAAVSAIAVLGLAFGVLRWSVFRVRAALEVRALRRTMLVSSLLLIGCYAAGHTPTFVRAIGWFSLPVSRTYWQQAEFAYTAIRHARHADDRLCVSSALEPDLRRLGGRNVVLVFVESYGATTYDRADIAGIVHSVRGQLLETAVATGRQVVSAFVESPTFGGGSWLAHMSLMTARPVRDHGTYGLLLTQDCDVLTKAFARGGYRVVGAMPGLKREWPEGAFYGYDEIYGEQALQYAGPDFGWWRIPDQYALAKVDALELRATREQPALVVFPSINSHAPFRPTPPYQPDWMRVLGADPYAAEDVERSLAVAPDWTNLGRDYAEAIAYVFEVLGGYLRERAEADDVLIVIGDHQPPASVSGAAARWDVPVHVIARDAAWLEALTQAGFVAGVEPAMEPIGPMHALAGVLFGAQSAAVPEAAEPFTSKAPSMTETRTRAAGIDIARIGTHGQRRDEAPHAVGIEPVAD